MCAVRMALNIVVLLVVVVGGWLLGSFYPAPAEVKALVGQKAGDLGRLEVAGLDWEGLSSLLPADQVDALQKAASEAAVADGEAIEVESVEVSDYAESFVAEWAGLESPAKAAAPAAAASPSAAKAAPAAKADVRVAGFESSVSLCPRMTVSNAPALQSYAPLVKVNGVAVAANPTIGACLSSGFGPRGNGTHKGVDYHSDSGGPILAAADGVVLEKKYRDDYGNMLLIDHGQGVYTRYAHLSSFSQGLAVGAKVKAGEQIGLMGNTAAYRIPIHLHYELLTGDYANPKGSFGLKPNSPFEFSKAT